MHPTSHVAGRDVIGLAETGSGKTAAFALPVLDALLKAEGNTANFAVVMAPTRSVEKAKKKREKKEKKEKKNKKREGRKKGRKALSNKQ